MYKKYNNYKIYKIRVMEFIQNIKCTIVCVFFGGGRNLEKFWFVEMYFGVFCTIN